MATAYPGLGFDPTPGSAAAVSDVVARLTQGCDQVDGCVMPQPVRGWAGAAAEAYTSSVAELPPGLAQLRRALERAARTLETWQSRLLDNQREAARLDALARSPEGEGDLRGTLAAAERLRARHTRQATAVAAALRGGGWVWNADASALSAGAAADWAAAVSWLGAPPVAGATSDVLPVGAWVHVATPDGQVVTLPIDRPGELPTELPTDRPAPVLAEGVASPTSRTPAGATPAYLTDAAGLHAPTEPTSRPTVANHAPVSASHDVNASSTREVSAGGTRPVRAAGGTRHLATPDAPRHAAPSTGGTEPRRYVTPQSHATPSTGSGAPHPTIPRGPATNFTTVAESSTPLPPATRPGLPTAAPPPGPTSDHSAPAEPTKQPARLPSNTPLTNGIPADALRQAPDHGTPADTTKQPTRTLGSTTLPTSGNAAESGKHPHQPHPADRDRLAEPDEGEPGDVILPLPATLPSLQTAPTPLSHGLDIFLLHHGGRRVLVLADSTSDTGAALFLPVLQGVS